MEIPKKYLEGQTERVKVHLKLARAALDSLEAFLELGIEANFTFSLDALIRSSERRDTLLYLEHLEE